MNPNERAIGKMKKEDTGLGRVHDTWLTALRFLCAVALLSVGFAHKVPAGSPPYIPPFEAAAFALPDGTTPDICLTGEHGDREGVGHGGGQDHGRASGDCEACRLTATTLLALPLDTVGRPMAISMALDFAARPMTLVRLFTSPNTLPRAPPAI